jgi:hypothetical protein
VAKPSLWPVLLLPLVATACKAKTPVITEPFSDTFDRAEVGPSWLDTSGGNAKVVNGEVVLHEGFNRPLWLRKRLPPDAVVEVEMTSKSPDGDLKVELYGDGQSADPDQGTYDPTGYVFVFGGWQNSLSIIGKLGEHEDAVKVSRRHSRAAAGAAADGLDVGVVPGKTYKFTITRKGGSLDWKIDGQPFLSWTDPEPLGGEQHSYLAFTNWKVEAHADNLRIAPAP